VLGYEAGYVGTAEFVRAGQARARRKVACRIVPATFKITSARLEAGVGDRCRRCRSKNSGLCAARAGQARSTAASSSVYGEACAPARTRSSPSTAAASDGMERGHVLALWRAGAPAVTAPAPSRPIRLPDERHGVLFVFRVFDRVSYALIVNGKTRCAPATASPSPDPAGPRRRAAVAVAPGRHRVLARGCRLLHTPASAVTRHAGCWPLSVAPRPSLRRLARCAQWVDAPTALALPTSPSRQATPTGSPPRGLAGGGPQRHVLTWATRLPGTLAANRRPAAAAVRAGRNRAAGAARLAVVGSRRPTVQGPDNARAFAQSLSRAGLVVVSGLALGIDGAAHEGRPWPATRPHHRRGGHRPRPGLPARHRDWPTASPSEVPAVSEYCPGTPPLPENFPQRNRIIAGLSLGTLVVEAALQSGSLITARLASEAGREVFAVPGLDPWRRSRGCHALIRQGAKLVESRRHWLEELLHLAPLAAAHRAEPVAAPERPTRC
jgi:DNA processing protein